MKLWLRMIWAFNGWRLKPKINIDEVGRRNFRVWPSDLDAFMHMNNGVYLSIMDLGRFDHLLRSGRWDVYKKLRWYPVVVNVSITYRKSLELWKTFVCETKVIGWDEQAFFVEQRFTRGGEIYSMAIVKLRWLKNPRGILTPQEVMDAAGGWIGKLPILPAWVVKWNSDAALPKGREPAPSNWD